MRTARLTFQPYSVSSCYARGLQQLAALAGILITVAWKNLHFGGVEVRFDCFSSPYSRNLAFDFTQQRPIIFRRLIGLYFVQRASTNGLNALRMPLKRQQRVQFYKAAVRV